MQEDDAVVPFLDPHGDAGERRQAFAQLAQPSQPFIVQLDSGGAGANFNNTFDYTLAIAGFNLGVSNFNAGQFSVDTTAFTNANPAGGTFGVNLVGTNLYLTYSGINVAGMVTVTGPAGGMTARISVNGGAVQTLQTTGTSLLEAKMMDGSR